MSSIFNNEKEITGYMTYVDSTADYHVYFLRPTISKFQDFILRESLKTHKNKTPELQNYIIPAYYPTKYSPEPNIPINIPVTLTIDVKQTHPAPKTFYNSRSTNKMSRDINQHLSDHKNLSNYSVMVHDYVRASNQEVPLKILEEENLINYGFDRDGTITDYDFQGMKQKEIADDFASTLDLDYSDVNIDYKSYELESQLLSTLIGSVSSITGGVSNNLIARSVAKKDFDTVDFSKKMAVLMPRGSVSINFGGKQFPIDFYNNEIGSMSTTKGNYHDYRVDPQTLFRGNLVEDNRNIIDTIDQLHLDETLSADVLTAIPTKLKLGSNITKIRQKQEYFHSYILDNMYKEVTINFPITPSFHQSLNQRYNGLIQKVFIKNGYPAYGSEMQKHAQEFVYRLLMNKARLTNKFSLNQSEINSFLSTYLEPQLLHMFSILQQQVDLKSATGRTSVYSKKNTPLSQLESQILIEINSNNFSNKQQIIAHLIKQKFHQTDVENTVELLDFHGYIFKSSTGFYKVMKQT